MTKSKEQQETRNSFRDTNIELIQRALETRTEITLTPRRSHTIRGIPLEFDFHTLRVYIDTGRAIESVLISEIGHFSFPRELWNLKILSDVEKRSESATDYIKSKKAEKGKNES
jgi:hypothetical protein